MQTVSAFSERVDAALIGPGMQDEPSVCEFVAALLPQLASCKVILDAAAMGVVRKPAEGSGKCARIERFADPVILTPHAGEMAHLTGTPKETILAAPDATASTAARTWNAVVTLKAATTFVAAPSGSVWRHDGGNVGLAVSGSGDTLAGIIAGLAARGAALEQAAVWAVALHARAGERLAARLGPLGYLAREIVDEVPGLMHALSLDK